MRPASATALLLAALLASACRAPPGPFELRGAFAPNGLHALTAGTAEVDFTPEPGYPLGGFGGGARRNELPFLAGAGWMGRLALDAHQAWHEDDPDPSMRADMLEPARGAHEPLTAKALVLEAGGLKLALVRFDAVVGSDRIHDRVAERTAARGFRKEAIVVAATHTHSGPGAYLEERAARIAGTDNFRPELLERMAAACTEAVLQADSARRPAAIGFGRAFDRGPDGAPRVAVNRRSRYLDGIAPDALDPEIGLVKVADARTRETIAVLVNFAVHPTVLGPTNLCFSQDLAGGIERGLARALAGSGVGGREPAVLFFNAAEGDAGPRLEGGLREVGILGDALALSAAPVVRGLALSDRVEIGAAYGERHLGDPWIFVAAGGRERFLAFDDCLAAKLGTAPLTLPLNLVAWVLLGLFEARVQVHVNGTAGVYVALDGYARTNTYRFHAASLRTGSGRRALFVSFPGEALHRVGLRAKALARERGADQAFVLGLANGALGYIADEEEYFRGGYESLVTLYGPGTAARCEEAVAACLDALRTPAPPP